MELVSAGYRATLMGFCGEGTTPGAALDDLLAKMRDYGATSDDFERSLAPGGHLSKQLRQIEQLVGQIAQGAIAGVSLQGRLTNPVSGYPDTQSTLGHG
jgi:hypothetical protein